MDDQWVPLGANSKDLEALHEGVPPWMATRFYAWVDACIVYIGDRTRETSEYIAAEFDERLRLPKPLAPEANEWYLAQILKKRGDDDLTLRFADFLLMRMSRLVEDSQLEEILDRAGSAWRVGQRNGIVGLERRVPLGVQEAVDAVMASTGDAGKLLSEAWHALFKIDPDYEEAYEKAIKAVEEAGARKVAPKNDLTTLGTMARDMEAQKTWALPLGDDRTPPATDAVTKMVRLLWQGQESRHGGNGYRKPTPEEAESAVFLAVSLVQFFHADLVQRR